MKCKKCWIAAAVLCAVMACVGLAGCGGDPEPAAVKDTVLISDTTAEYLGRETNAATGIGSGAGLCENRTACPNDGVCINDGVCDGSGAEQNNRNCGNGGSCDGTGQKGVRICRNS